MIIGPGDLYTSLVPNLLVTGMKEALRQTKGKVIYFVNLMTKFGETAGFKASDFLKVTENYLGQGVIDFVAVNNTKPVSGRFRSYIMEKSEFVEVDMENFGKKPMPIVTSLMRRSGLIRHDPEKVAKLVTMVV